MCPTALRHAIGQCLLWGQCGEDLNARVVLPVGSGHRVQATLAKEAMWVRPVLHTCVSDGQNEETVTANHLGSAVSWTILVWREVEPSLCAQA